MVDTRARIVTATQELFRVRGFHATSIKQVSGASGATTGSIYHFFPGGKDELTAEVIESSGRSYGELVELLMRAASDPAAAIVDAFDSAAAVVAETDFIDLCPIGGIAREVASTNEPLRKAAAAAIESWIDTIASVLAEAGIDSTEARNIAVTVVATIEGAFMMSRTMRSTAPLTSAGRQLARLVDHAQTRSAPPISHP